MRGHVWMVVLYTVSGLVVLVILVGVVARLVGQRLPEHVSFAYVTRLDTTPEEVWAKLGLPHAPAQVRELPDGTRHEVAMDDTSGTLVLRFEPDSLVVYCTTLSKVRVLTSETFTRDGASTIVRGRMWGDLRGPIHRLVFPPVLKRQAMDGMRNVARAVGQPGAPIESDPAFDGSGPHWR